MNVVLVKTINLGGKVYPNSLVLIDHVIYGCDAKNRIFSIDNNSQIQFKFGSEGFGKYKFRQPVFITGNSNVLIIADWHNHRIVFYNKNRDYLFEMGHLGILKNSGFSNYIVRVKKIIGNHEYIINHNGAEIIKVLNLDTFWKKIERLFYSLFLSKNINKKVIFNKPNGISFSINKMLLTQKNNQTFQIFEYNNNDISTLKLIKEVAAINNIKMGRLGNCILEKSEFYICDESNCCIWVVNQEGEFIRDIRIRSPVLPFTCCFINNGLMAIGGVQGLVILNSETSKVEFEDLDIGEVHSLVFCIQTMELLVCCRDLGVIKIIQVS